MTGGMDNPVDVVFTPGGERIFTTTFLQHPGGGQRDGLIHAVYGGVYGKVHDVIDGHPRTGPTLMPVLTHLGPAGPVRPDALRVATPSAPTIATTSSPRMFNLHKVTRHVLDAERRDLHDARRATSSSRDDRDFHPTDVLEDADGSLLVVDTGGWYKLCCPTSQLAQAGRARRRSTACAAQAPRRVRDPRGLRSRLEHDDARRHGRRCSTMRGRLCRSRAIQQLGKAGDGCGSGARDTWLRTPRSAEARRNAVWALTRIDGAPARDGDPHWRSSDRTTLSGRRRVHSAGLWRDGAALPQLVEALSSGQPALQRVAAEALGRIGDARAVPDARRSRGGCAHRPRARALAHLRADRNRRSRGDRAAGLQARPRRARRAALIALDQMDGGGLKPEELVPLLDSPDPVLKDTAWWIAGRHPEWGDALAGFFDKQIAAGLLASAERDQGEPRIAQFGQSPAIQALLAATVDGTTVKATRLGALRAMAAVATTRVKELPSAWAAPLARALTSGDVEVVHDALSVARAVPAAAEKAPQLRTALLRVARDEALTIDLRLDAMAAMHGAGSAPDADVFELLRASLDPARPAAVRAAAAGILGRSRLDRQQLRSLARSLETAGPLELPRLLAAFDNPGDGAPGIEMIEALERSKTKSSVRADILRPLLEKYPEPVRARGEALLASLATDPARQAKRLDQLLSEVQGGDIHRGQAVFNGPKGACLSCHTIGYMGGKIGPDLTRIGQIRGERDLLEAIVFPNASFARGYEPLIVTTRTGGTHGGVLRGDLRDEIVLATTEREQTRIPRRDIADMEPGTVSLMPSGYADQLTRGELADVLSFLRAAGVDQSRAERKPVPLFDGKTFEGWEGDKTIFRIEDGAIVGGSLERKVARNEFLCTTKPYGDFELRIKVKLVGGDGANAGIQFRTKRIPNHHEVSGYQADMGTGWWGALYDESRRNKVLKGPDQAKMKGIVKAGDWNDYVIRAEGKRIQLWINGVQTVDYTEEDPAIDATGMICPQIHGGPPSEAWYRDISIVDLTK